MALSICFILGALGPSGGVRAVLEHARRLSAEHGMDVTVAVWEPPGEAPPVVSVVTLDEARERRFDVAVATWWRTAYSLYDVPAERRAYFVQQLEERVYRPGDVERVAAAVTHGLPAAFVTEAAWIADLLGELRPEALCLHVPNGVDKALFRGPEAAPAAADGPLRLLVEGSPRLWYKGVAEAAAVIERMDAPRHATLVTPEAIEHPGSTFDRVVGPLAHEEMPALY